MWRSTARLLAVPMLVTPLVATVAAPAMAAPSASWRSVAQQAAAQGVAVEITERPDEFVAGARPEILTVVASKRGGRNCLKVRWSMLLQLEGLSLEQVRIDRIEEDGSFPIDVEAEGDSARVTDEQLDPGTLCRDRTVTARYEVNVARDVPAGRLTLRAEAYDANLELLERDQATLPIVGGQAEPTEPATEAPAAGAGGAQPPADAADQQAIDPAADDQQGLPLAWFLIGGVMVFLGFSLLLNLRRRQREQALPDAVPAAAGAPDAGYRSPAYDSGRYRTVPRRADRWS